MSHVTLSDQGSTPFERLLGHVPAIAEPWGQLETAFFQSQHFSPEFLEQVRRALAFHNQCQYCMAKAGQPDANPESVRLQQALRFANLFAMDHASIAKEEIENMRRYFSEQEVVELLAFCSFISAAQRFGACLGLQPASHYAEHQQPL